MGIYHGDYSDDVNTVLQKRASASNLLRFGAEVETGWHEERTRSLFFRALDDKGIDKVAISKFDRSIESAQSSEIVTLPMKAKELSEVLGTIGETLLAHFDKNNMRGCGVHIHATRDPLDLNAFWRVVQAICVDNTSWQYLPGHRDLVESPKGFMEQAEQITDFWSKVALRHPTSYCSRQPYGNVAQADGKANHGRAVTRGKKTPTIEFRLFKSARSPVVLRSYVETVASLIAFSTAPPEELLEKVDMDHMIRVQTYEKALRTLSQTILEDPDLVKSTQGYYGVANIRDEHVLEWIGRPAISHITMGYKWAKYKFYCEERGQPSLPQGVYESYLTEEGRLSFTKPSNSKPTAQGWLGGLFPFRTYMEYVAHNKAEYPALASRFALDKFAVYLTGEKQTTSPVVWDETPPHTDIEAGCRVRIQSNTTPQDYRVMKCMPGFDKMICAEDIQYKLAAIRRLGTDSVNELHSSYQGTISGDDLLHICSGASHRESHGE